MNEFSKHIWDSPYFMVGDKVDYVEIEDAIVLGDKGFILNSKNELIKSLCDEHIYWTPRAISAKWMENRVFDMDLVEERFEFLKYLAHESRTKSGPVGGSKVLNPDKIWIDLTHTFGWYAFGHLHDSLQRIFGVRDLLKKNDKHKIGFIVSNYNRIIDFFTHLSVLVGWEVGRDSVEVIKPLTVYKVKKLIRPTSQSRMTDYTDSVYDWIVDSYSNYFEIDEARVVEGVYLSRNHISPGRRGVLNEAEVIGYLQNKNYIVLTGSESLKEIFEIFSLAKNIVGPHGSLFANTIFCANYAKIVEYCPANRVDYSFRNKNKRASSYSHNLVESDSMFNIRIPLEEL